MASKKKTSKFSEQQILQYILQGGSPADLEDAGIDMNQIVVAMLKNPEILSGFRAQAETVGSALESFNPDETYYDPTEIGLDPSYVNPIKDKWLDVSRTNVEAAGVAKAYFDAVQSVGNDPSKQTQIRMDAESLANSLGISPEDSVTLLDNLEADRDIFYRTEKEVERKVAAKNYDAFQKKRSELKLGAGETAQENIFKKLTGLPEMVDIPDPKTTFAELAKKKAAEVVPAPEEAVKLAKANAPRGTLGRGSKGGAATVAKAALAGKKAESDRSRYEQAFLMEVEKAGKTKSTPYQEAVKKLLPQILAKKKLGL